MASRGNSATCPPCCRPRRRRVPLHEREQRETRVRHRQARIDSERRAEGILGARAVGEEAIHALLKMLDGSPRRRGDLEAVAICGGHAGSIAGPRKSCDAIARRKCRARRQRVATTPSMLRAPTRNVEAIYEFGVRHKSDVAI